jgi:hypothetical protein
VEVSVRKIHCEYSRFLQSLDNKLPNSRLRKNSSENESEKATTEPKPIDFGSVCRALVGSTRLVGYALLTVSLHSTRSQPTHFVQTNNSSSK